MEDTEGGKVGGKDADYPSNTLSPTSQESFLSAGKRRRKAK
jgi:hypothetical protein